MTSSLQDGGTVATLYEFLWVLVNTNKVEIQSPDHFEDRRKD